MIESLYIKDLVLVSELQIDFSAGFNTVTGETGAGKSLILGALQLLSGGRASSSVIRKGARSCEVAAVVYLSEQYQTLAEWLAKKLDEYALPACEEGRLLLRRVITESGSRAFVNGSPVTAAILRSIGERLIDIHGPNENQSLLLPSQQLRLLDLYGNHRTLLHDVALAYQELVSYRKQLQDLAENILSPEELELVSHQLQEIDRAKLSPEEEQQLIAQHKTAANSARLRELADALAMQLAMGDNAITDALAPIIRMSEELADLDETGGSDFVNRLNVVSEEISSIAQDLQDYASRMDFDGEALQNMENRIALIQKLKRRFGPTVEDVLAAAERLRSRVKSAQSHTSEVERLKTAETQCMARLKELSAVLSEKRHATAQNLAPAISEKLRVLGFANAHFEVHLASCPVGMTGADSCEFFFAPNRGEECTALRHSASSGEVARVMLAIKTVLSEVDEVPVLVFDEIDANIGGRTAAAVATELRAVGRHHQVFSITHLPLIAASGNHQYIVEKHLDNDRTVTSMRELCGDERVAEIVRMLGAASDDRVAKAHAQEMLNSMQS